MVISSRFSRILLVVFALAIASVMIRAGVQQLLAEYWASKGDPYDLKRALRMEPDNADLWLQLGLYEEQNPLNRNLTEAAKDFQRGTQLNPSSSAIWIALARTYEEAGVPQQANRAYKVAESINPHYMDPDVEWAYGGFLLRQGDTAQAVERFHRALLHKPDRTMAAVSQCFKAGAGIDLVLNQLLPRQPSAYLDTINYFTSQRNYDAALESWKKLVSLDRHVPLASALNLVNALIAQNRIDDAEGVWKQALAISGYATKAQRHGSLIFNGDFDKDPLNGGFGWRQQTSPGTAFDLVGDITHGSVRAARVAFYGSANVNYHNLWQYVAISPGKRYRFSADMRTDSISTDSGPHFVLANCSNPSQDVAESIPMTGTHAWTEVEAAFDAASTLNCVIVTLRREPSQLFDNQIRGTVWVDNVRLEEVQGGEPEVKEAP